jgi:hypothetical protein
VFFQRRGLPNDVPEEVLYPEYWETILIGAAKRGLDDTLKALPSLGLGNLAKSIKDAAVTPVEDYPELAQVLAIQAREIHFKVECLKAEWSGNGWEIVTGDDADKDTAKRLSIELGWVAEGIIDVRSRTYAKAPSYFAANNSAKLNKAIEGSIAAFEAGEEPQGPIDAAHQHRWKVEQLVGNHPFIDDEAWWAAFKVADPQEIAALRLRALVMMPEQDFKTLQWWATLATIGKAVEDAPALPNLPVSYRELGKAALFRQCPIKAAIAGELTQWDKDHTTVQAAKDWAIANAKQLAALSRHEQRWLGLQFTEKTPAVKCFHKLLGMVGLEAKCAKRAQGGGTYRLKTASDVDKAISEIDWKDAGAELKHKRLQRDLYRIEHDPETLTAIATRIRSQGAAALSDWEKYQAALMAETQAQSDRAELQNKPDSLTEVLHSPPTPINSGHTQPPDNPIRRVWGWLNQQWQAVELLCEERSAAGFKLWDGSAVRWSHYFAEIA